jgi:transcriptional/translational regulatory protein YebC/TACO1
MRHLLSKLGYELASPGSALWAFTKSGDGFVANMTVDLSEEDMQKMVDLYDQLDNHDDVQAIYTNVTGLDEIISAEE